MDGNGRWAEGRGLPIAEGHRAGTRALRRTVEAAIDLGLDTLTVYAFSTENWTRSEDEVGALMEIFEETIERELPDLAAQGVRVALHRTERPRAGGSPPSDGAARDGRRATTTAWRCGSRSTTAAAPSSSRPSAARPRGRRPRDVDEEALAEAMYAPDMPEPDLLIRTSGEFRISNFLLWRLAYSELVFVDTLWPDFGAAQLQQALDTFAQRRRRFGGR